MIIAQRPDGIRILRITRPEEAIAYRASFAGAYQDIFSEAPYNERIFPSEAEGVLTAYLQTADNLTLLALSPKNKVVGFGIGLPLMSRPDIMRELRGLLPVRERPSTSPIWACSPPGGAPAWAKTLCASACARSIGGAFAMWCCAPAPCATPPTRCT